MPSWFELSKNHNSQYYFVLKSAQHEPVLSSKFYESKNAAHKGISAVRTNSQSDDRYERRISQTGQPYFVLKADNNHIIGLSQIYASVAACDSGMAFMKVKGSTVTIVEKT